MPNPTEQKTNADSYAQAATTDDSPSQHAYSQPAHNAENKEHDEAKSGGSGQIEHVQLNVPNPTEQGTSEPIADLKANKPKIRAPHRGPSVVRDDSGDEAKEGEGSPAQGLGPFPSGDSKRPRGRGDSRPHRAFQTLKLPDSYANETKVEKSDMVPVIHMALQNIKMFWTFATKPDALTAAEIDALRKHLPRRMPVTAATTDAELKGYAKELHTKETTKLRREELDVTDEGILMQTTAAGRVPCKTEDGKPDGVPIIEGRLVKYDDKPEDQEKTRVEFRGGKLFRSRPSDPKNAEVDTTESVTHQSGPGFEIFAVDAKNEIHMASHKIGKYHHSSLLAGGNVAMAGEMKVEKGKITYLSNKSGHYVPGAEALVQFLHFLDKDGVAMDFRVFDQGGKVGGTAAEVLAGKSPGKEDAAMTYEAIKTNVVWASFVAEFGEPAVLKVITEQGWTGKGKDVVDGAGKAVDLRVVRRLLKQELGAKKRAPEKSQGGRAKIKLETNRLNSNPNKPAEKSVSVIDTKWVN